VSHKSHSGSRPENQNLLATQPINTLFMRLAMPMVFGMLINGLYNLVDAFFVSQFIGSDAMAAVSIAFPLQMVIISLAASISNGSSVLVSQFLGANNPLKANHIVSNAIRLIILLAVMIAVISFFLQSSLLQILQVPTTLKEGVIDYFMPLALGSILVFLLSLLSDLLRAQGKMKALLVIILMGAIANILLDALFIVVFDWGLTGAATATLSAQLLGCILGIKYFSPSNSILKLQPLSSPLNVNIAKNILALGAPVLIQYAGASILIALINAMISFSINDHTVNWLSAYGIIGRLNIFMILPLIAMTNATQTIVSFNHGANNKARTHQALRQGIKASVVYLSIMASLLLAIPNVLLAAFTNDKVVIELGVEIAQMMFIFLPLAGISSTAVAFLQGIGYAKQALLLSMVKVYFLVLPLLFVIHTLWGFEKLWYAFPLADLGALALVSGLFIVYKKNNTRQLVKGAL